MDADAADRDDEAEGAASEYAGAVDATPMTRFER
jgi:hypothetical protein